MATPLVFRQADGTRIKLAAKVVGQLRQYAQLAPGAPEAGGILLGRYLQDSEDVVVDAVTVPMPGDQQGRYFFHRARQAHQQAVEEAWQATAGTRTYLGEWHTHPEPDPTPSCVDLLDWRRKLRQDQYFASLFFFIVGTRRIRGWSGSCTQRKLLPLTPSSSPR